ncbi:MAG: methyltransferase [Deltaproteobacteria bacterium]|nr:methyltransferase [Deltaproteobacteria bacterium]
MAPPIVPISPVVSSTPRDEEIPRCPAAGEVNTSEPNFTLPPTEQRVAQTLTNSSTVKLLAGQCSLISIGGTQSVELEVPDQSAMSVPLVQFELSDDHQQCVATNLQIFLDGIAFDQANQLLHPDSYGITSIYDANPYDALARLQNSGLSIRQQEAIAFFMYGKPLSLGQTQELFDGNLELLAELQGFGIIGSYHVNGQVIFRLNELGLTSRRLPNGEISYLFFDLPQALRSSGAPVPTAQISSTSFILQTYLEDQYRAGTRYRGVAADFGAGTGIFAITLLQLHPDLEKAIALEIDPQAMNLNRFNAMVNDVADRMVVVDNMDPNNFTQALAGRKLNLAVSNPPFNAVPKSYAAEFTDFGDGGPRGLDVTEIFLDQALPVLEKDAPFILYSVLVEGREGKIYATAALQERSTPWKGRGLQVDYAPLGFERLTMGAHDYANFLAYYLLEQRKWQTGQAEPIYLNPQDTPQFKVLQSEIQQALKADGVVALRPYLWTIRATELPLGLQVTHNDNMRMKKLELAYSRHSQEPDTMGEGKKGGVYINIVRMPDLREGVYRELHRVSHESLLRQSLEEYCQNPEHANDLLCKILPKWEILKINLN